MNGFFADWFLVENNLLMYFVDNVISPKNITYAHM
jgi:hypothetical protein